MKKTLAILLALLAATTITLASCKEEPTTNVDGWDDDNDYVATGDTSDDTADTTADTTTDKENGENTNVTGWVEKNDTVYAGVNELNIRTSASAANNTNVYKQVNAGTALTRKATNGKWDKVVLEGGETEYYVLHNFVSETNDNFTFTAVTSETPVLLTLNEGKILRLYTTPFEVYDGNVLNFTNIHARAAVKAVDGEIKKVAVSNNNWIKITVKGTVTYDGNTTETFETETEFFLSPYAVSKGRVNDPERPASSGNGNSGGNG